MAVLDSSLELVDDIAVGDGGFAHVHPTMAYLGDRLYFAWSKRSERGAPQVQVECYKVTGASREAIEIIDLRHVTGSAGISLDFTSSPGASYLIEVSDDLSIWSRLEDAFPSGGEQTTFTDAGLPADHRRRFYRISENEG